MLLGQLAELSTIAWNNSPPGIWDNEPNTQQSIVCFRNIFTTKQTIKFHEYNNALTF